MIEINHGISDIKSKRICCISPGKQSLNLKEYSGSHFFEMMQPVASTGSDLFDQHKLIKQFHEVLFQIV
jgi:hypothetical protein